MVHPLFPGGEKVEFPNEQELDEDGMLGRAFSASAQAFSSAALRVAVSSSTEQVSSWAG